MSAWRTLKVAKINQPYDPYISLLGICPKDLIRKSICSSIFTVVQFGENPSIFQLNQWMDDENVAHMKYYPESKKNKIMNFASKWVELEKNNISSGNPDLERHVSNVLYH